MKLAEQILYKLAKAWPNPVKEKQTRLGEDPTSEHYLLNYALFFQYDAKVKTGLGVDIRGKRVLEIGCGHGGITCFIGVNGAVRAVGIDINVRNLEVAQKLKNRFPVLNAEGSTIEFYNMDATELAFDSESFDVILADNVFEHFMEPEKVLKECYRVLSSSGTIVIGGMPSFYSKYGLHLKNGLRFPWANLFFSQRTICSVMIKICQEDPRLAEIYPGVRNYPKRVKDLRAYGDLNGMTYGRFRRIAAASGFRISKSSISPTPRLLGHLVQLAPVISKTLIGDIFSVTARFYLTKV